MASRVVPGISETIARSSPSSALSRLDLPTFGRPTKAIAAGSPSVSAAIAASHFAASASTPSRSGPRRHRSPSASPASGSPTTNGSRWPAATSSAHASASASRALRASSASLSGGSAQTIASSRSPVPRPWVAEIAYVSSQPSAWNSAPSSSRFSLSALLTDDDHRRRRAPQDARRLEVGRGHAGHRVDDEQDDVGLGDREAGLLLDARLDRVVRDRARARRCRRRRSAGRSTRRRRTGGRASCARGPRRWPCARRRSG